MTTDVAVVGAGVIGLSTAINVQTTIPGARVTVIADKLYEGTTSYGSGGMFIPSITSLPNESIEDLRNWCRESWNFYRKLSLSPEASEIGTIIMSGYDLVDQKLHPKDPLYKEFVFSTEELSRSELTDLGFQQFRTGFRVTTIIIFMRKYLIWLRKRFEENGGKIEKRHLNSLGELSGQYDIVMNCCGPSSAQLVNDNRAYPVRGHIVRVRAPWIKHWFLTDGHSYIIPGEDLVRLGGVKQVGNTSLEVDPRDTKAIMEGVEKLCPNIKGAVVESEWVGLRPGRDRVRLEPEIMHFGGKRLPVVHNYGHSSQGIGLSWGTSVYAARLAADILKSGAKL
ncbi:D-aspartate oxidase-like [Ruditapes philippinarum]|uniref:D-aspartate oxidase-like n=1 Tax=Ruditapes philippinarum TaxID=129788 RepID=UPI00295B355F|nr:D-aspartate oxidase-like [Ruditapes philippinarum]